MKGEEQTFFCFASGVAAHLATDLPDTVDRLHATLGDTAFDERAAAGANMELGDAVAYAQAQIQQSRRQAATPSPSGA